MINHFKHTMVLIFVISVPLFNASPALAQTTAFTYQGRLTDSGNPATGIYDLTFTLFDTATVGSGTQQGATLTLTSVEVTNGTFSVQLDFGPCASCFDGAGRFLEIGVKPAGGSTFTTLSPRQPVTATPYAIKSLSAATADSLSVTCVNCVASSQIAGVSGGAVIGTIPVSSVPAESPNYIQNSVTQQPLSNFNISGDGTVGRILTAGFLQVNATSFGMRVQTNTAGGTVASFGGFGDLRIDSTTNVGGRFIVTENGKVGIGKAVPGYRLEVLETGTNGLRVQTNATGGTLASFGGFGEFRIDSAGGGEGGRLTVTEPGSVGIGVSAPSFKLHVIDAANTGLRIQTNTAGGTVASFGGFGDFQIDAPGVPAGRFVVKENGFVGIGTATPSAKLEVNGGLIINNGTVGIGTATPRTTLEVGGGLIFVPGLGGATSVCRTSLNLLAACSSSLRYKTNIADLSSGLNLINRLRPVTFDWKESKAHDLGLVAEEVAEVEPLLVTHNDKGEIEGVKYDRINVVLINAIREQQRQIESLKEQLQKLIADKVRSRQGKRRR